ncbi:hypothetical protein NTD80_00925 [Pseudomonas sp. 13B_2.1_Bac1]|uniref:hypothetical protein n=1 Tax=Pseudomonas sp. 13B_2.1_Bac1 TaxID=2971624 RepID=UPI0021C88245|nr:hypothetical protein [Pseudomonas sp. 13B_2.1_Bac1]MCU1781300.1 hypothetical protein [Pseudomonas sp. 13B_2.1_Bac1]
MFLQHNDCRAAILQPDHLYRDAAYRQGVGFCRRKNRWMSGSKNQKRPTYRGKKPQKKHPPKPHKKAPQLIAAALAE